MTKRGKHANNPWRKTPHVKRHANYQRMVKWGALEPKKEQGDER
jgi:hypothetical protein